MRARRWAPLVAAGLVALAACDAFEPEWVERLDIRPDSAHIGVGESVTFDATPVSEQGTPLPDRAGRVAWALNGSQVATLDTVGGTVRVTAVALGQATLVARLGRATVQLPVFVQPPGLARIEIEPDRIEVAAGARPRVEARLYDAQGNVLSPQGFRISWVMGDPTVGFVGTPTGPSADLLARRVGTTTLRLIVGSLSTAIPFIVR